MVRQNTAPRQTLFRHGPLAMALVLSVILSIPVLAAPQTRGPGSHLMFWHSYFPLETGNRWIYAVKGPGSVWRNWEVKVKGEQSTSLFRSYFELSGYLAPKDPRLVRLTMFGSVVERGDDGKEYLWYEFGGRVGRSWTMDLAPGEAPSCEDGATLRVGARDEVVAVPAGEFKQVIRIDFMTKCFDAGITHEWFAPGVGLIRREENSIAGPVVSELVYAEVGERVLRSGGYSTTLQLSSSEYVNNLMPPVDPSKLPRVTGVFIVRDQTSEPAELVFPSGCTGLLLEVRNKAGEVVLSINTLAAVACPAVVMRFDLAKEALVVPFSFVLVDKSGEALPDGDYSVTAVLQTETAHETLRPAARAAISVKSVH